MASRRNSKSTSADTIRMSIILSSCLEPGVKRHAAIDEQGCALDVIGFIARKPNRGAADLLRLADALIWNQFQQFIVMLGRVPGLHVDRCANGTRRDRVHA